MVPSCRLLVYYVRKDGETVADSMVVDIEDKLENQVGFSQGNLPFYINGGLFVQQVL
jgi:hypothetical protein